MSNCVFRQEHVAATNLRSVHTRRLVAGTCRRDKITTLWDMFLGQNLQKFLLRRCKHLSTHEESRIAGTCRRVLFLLHFHACTCCNFVAATRLCYTSPLHAFLCVQNANLSLLCVPETWPLVWADLKAVEKLKPTAAILIGETSWGIQWRHREGGKIWHFSLKLDEESILTRY